MNLRKEIGTGQLFCLLIVCRLSVALTFPFDSVGSFNNQEWFAAVLFFPILLSVMSFLLFFYNKTGLCPADAAAKTSPFFGKAVSLVFSVFFLLSAAVNLSRFNIFMTSTTGADQSPLFFPLLLIIPSVYAAYKGIEAISRTACIILVIGLVSAAVIILAVIPKFDMLNVLPPRSSDRKNVARLLMTYFSGTSEAAAFAVMLPKARGKKRFLPAAFSAAVAFGMFAIFFSVSAVFGELAEFENFPFFALADIAELGELKRLSALHASTWILGLYVKCGLFLQLSRSCAERVFEKSVLKPLSAVGIAAVFVLGTLMSSNYRYAKSPIYSVSLFISVALLTVVLPAVLLLTQKNNEQFRSKEGVKN